MDRRSIDYAAEIIRARNRLSIAAVEPLAQSMVTSVNSIRSSYQALRDIEPGWIPRILREEEPRATHLLLAVDLAVKALKDVCSATEEAVETHLNPSGVADALDRWGTTLAELLHDTDDATAPWYSNTAQHLDIPPEAKEEFRSVGWVHVIHAATVSGGVRLRLLSSVSVARLSLRDVEAPSHAEKRLSHWHRASLGALVFGIGAAELLLDLVHFQPLHSGVSLAGGVCSVGHGGHLLWHALRPSKTPSRRSRPPRRRRAEGAG